MNRGGDGFSPKVIGRLKFIQHCSCHLNKCPVLPLNNTILLRGIGCGELVLDPFILKELAHGVVLQLGTVVIANGFDLCFICALGLLGEVNEVLVGFILGLEEEHPCVS
jgi:hypothetical protein